MGSEEPNTDRQGRRGFLAQLLMATGLGSVAVSLAAIAGRYIYPLRAIRLKRSIYLAPAADIPPGTSKLYGLPGGENALVADTGSEYVALSNICPHLGCKVHYSESEGQFVCPCHNGIFDKQGKAISGPPADEGKNLKRFEVTRVGKNLFVEIEEKIQL